MSLAMPPPLIESPAAAGKIELMTALNPSAVEKAVTPMKMNTNSSNKKIAAIISI